MSAPATVSFAENFPKFWTKPFPLFTNGTEDTLQNYLLNVVDASAYGASTANSDNTAAIQAALDTGKNVRLRGVGTYQCSGQLVMQTTGQTLFGDGMFQTTLKMNYNGSGFPIYMGKASGASQILGPTIRDIQLWDPNNAKVLLQSGWARFVTFINVSFLCDGLIHVGDEALTLAKPSYVMVFYNCQYQQNAGGSMNGVDWWNFAGQFVMDGSFFEGAGSGGTGVNTSGVCSTNNIVSHSDNCYFVNGLLHRFDYNMDFRDGRVGNTYIHNMCMDEANHGAIYIDSSSGSSKPLSDVGAEAVQISDVLVDAKNGPAIYIGSHRAGSGTQRIQVRGVGVTGAAQATTPIVIENPAAATGIQLISVSDVNGFINAADNLQDVVRITANGTLGSIQDVSVDDINAQFVAGGTGRSAVRIEGAGIQRIAVGTKINAKKCSKAVDDQSTKALIAGAYNASDTFDYGTVSANSINGAHTVSVPGAVLARNDTVMVTVKSGGGAGLLVFSGTVTADNVVTITALNATSAGVASGSTILLIKVRPGDL